MPPHKAHPPRPRANRQKERRNKGEQHGDTRGECSSTPPRPRGGLLTDGRSHTAITVPLNAFSRGGESPAPAPPAPRRVPSAARVASTRALAAPRCVSRRRGERSAPSRRRSAREPDGGIKTSPVSEEEKPPPPAAQMMLSVPVGPAIAREGRPSPVVAMIHWETWALSQDSRGGRGVPSRRHRSST